MKKWTGFVILGLTLGGVGSAAFAQERIYRCGNEYTNSPARTKQGNCQVVQSGHVTVVHAEPKAPSSKSRPAAATDRQAAAVATRVTPAQQQARDRDARAILQAELAKAQQKLQTLQAQYNGGNPDKTALELRNPQVFQERLQALKADIARQQADVSSIERELARHTSGG